jgi:hypothetical protein
LSFSLTTSSQSNVYTDSLSGVPLTHDSGSRSTLHEGVRTQQRVELHQPC